MIGNYFFKDIKEEGKVLYDSERFKLANPKKLTTKQYQQTIPAKSSRIF